MTRFLFLLAVAAGLGFSAGCGRKPAVPAAPPPDLLLESMDSAEPAATTGQAVLVFVPPTARSNLWDRSDMTRLMPTASGNPESGSYGSVRTTREGKALVAAFHEGIDIAPTARDRKGEPLDPVCAAADGQVGYINRSGGNSAYGQYVVLTHADPLGAIYTLYAHLAMVSPELRVGQPVRAGQPIGRMGHTATTGIPGERAHTHFEAGIIYNDRFPGWYRAQKLKPDHGLYNGMNLGGIDPVAVYEIQHAGGRFRMAAHLAAQPPAFELVFRAAHPVDYFRRYPALWKGVAPVGGLVLLAVDPTGLILAGRPANEEEIRALGKRNYLVRKVDPTALGRNGARIILPRNGGWELGRDGRQWLEIIRY